MLVLSPINQTNKEKKEIYRKTISWKIFMYSTHCDRNRFYWTPKNHSLYCVWEMELECVAKKLVRELLFALCSAIRWGWLHYIVLVKIIRTIGMEQNGSVRNLGTSILFDFDMCASLICKFNFLLCDGICFENAFLFTFYDGNISLAYTFSRRDFNKNMFHC